MDYFYKILGAVVVLWFVYWLIGFLGRNQWPSPYGRYYNKWLKIKKGSDYYYWLAEQKQFRQPWVMWAKMDTFTLKELKERANQSNRD